MTSLPRSPRTLRGALVAVNSLTLRPEEIVPFQYNPHTLSRSYELRTGTSGPEVGQITSAPAESIKLEVELDAADQDEPTGVNGVAHQLAALENLITPSSTLVIANLVLHNVGTIEIAPPLGKLILFVWGPKRVLPVVITELSVTEEAHDVNLTPTVARVSLGLRVLNWDDVSQTHPAFGIALSHQMKKEKLGGLAALRSLENVIGSINLPL